MRTDQRFSLFLFLFFLISYFFTIQFLVFSHSSISFVCIQQEEGEREERKEVEERRFIYLFLTSLFLSYTFKRNQEGRRGRAGNGREE